MADILKIGRHGDVIIPRRVRAALDLKEGDELLLSVAGSLDDCPAFAAEVDAGGFPLVITSGAMRVEVERDPFRLTFLSRDGKESLLRSAPQGGLFFRDGENRHSVSAVGARSSSVQAVSAASSRSRCRTLGRPCAWRCSWISRSAGSNRRMQCAGRPSRPARPTS